MRLICFIAYRLFGTSVWPVGCMQPIVRNMSGPAIRLLAPFGRAAPSPHFLGEERKSRFQGRQDSFWTPKRSLQRADAG